MVIFDWKHKKSIGLEAGIRNWNGMMRVELVFEGKEGPATAEKE